MGTYSGLPIAFREREKRDVEFESGVVRYANEALIVRIVDEFQTYVADVLAEIYEKHPMALAARKFDQAILFEHDNLDDLKRRVLEDAVAAAMFSNVLSISEDLDKKLGFPIFEGWLRKNRIRRIVEIRNIITHNRGMVNRRFIDICGGRHDLVGQPVRLPKNIYISKYLDRVAEEIDLKAVHKFNLARYIERELGRPFSEQELVEIWDESN